jgi:hypothetical protein
MPSDAERFAQFLLGMGMEEVSIPAILAMDPKQCFDMGKNLAWEIDAGLETHRLEILELEKELRQEHDLHQKNAKHLGDQIAKIIGYSGPNDGDALFQKLKRLVAFYKELLAQQEEAWRNERTLRPCKDWVGIKYYEFK